jgi:hypothetical protein
MVDLAILSTPEKNINNLKSILNEINIEDLALEVNDKSKDLERY